jgi:GNAT superfamily N-acetyltransferase
MTLETIGDDALNIHWEVTTKGDNAADAVIDEGLDAYNSASADLGAVRPLRCYAREGDEVIGGVIARTWGACCEIQIIWVHESRRRRGIATELLARTEQAARARGCDLIYLETFSFQAPALYERAGYQEACSFRGFPGGIVKQLMQKRLADE